jgi:hypothetical protein
MKRSIDGASAINQTNNSTGIITMKNITRTLIALVTIASATQNIYADTAPALNAVSSEIARNGRYSVSVGDSTATISDAKSGVEVARMAEVSPTQITVTAVVARIANDDEALREAIRDRVATYNTSATAGTLDLDESTGIVSITYHANPRYVSASAIAYAATIVADAARSESMVIVAIQNGTASDCRSSYICSR